jgi:hypothetical protein
MPTQELVSEYEQARGRHATATRELGEVLVRMALATLAEVLPGAASIEAIGEYNEDWVPTLRIQRVLDGDNAVLFNVEKGHAARAIEDAVDLVNIEYLDVLMDLTGDDYMGPVTIA